MALKLVHITGMVGFSLLCLTNMDKVWKKADGYIKEIVRACPVVRLLAPPHAPPRPRVPQKREQALTEKAHEIRSR